LLHVGPLRAKPAELHVVFYETIRCQRVREWRLPCGFRFGVQRRGCQSLSGEAPSSCPKNPHLWPSVRSLHFYLGFSTTLLP
jgi:hypothetical protein